MRCRPPETSLLQTFFGRAERCEKRKQRDTVVTPGLVAIKLRILDAYFAAAISQQGNSKGSTKECGEVCNMHSTPALP